MMFKKLSCPANTLYINQEGVIKKPLLDPFGWQYPSIKTIYLSMLYVFNLIQNILNLNSFIFIKTPNCDTNSSIAFAQTYPEIQSEKNPSFDQTSGYLLVINTAGLLVLTSTWMTYKHRLFFQSPHKIYQKYPRITLLSPEMIHFTHLTFLLNMMNEIGSGESNQNVNPYLKIFNTSITCINIGSLLIQGVISSISLITPFNLDQQLTNTSHQVLKSVIKNPPALSEIGSQKSDAEWLKNRLKKLQECGFHSYVILNLLDALKTNPEKASYLKNFLNDLGPLKRDYSKRMSRDTSGGNEFP